MSFLNLFSKKTEDAVVAAAQEVEDQIQKKALLSATSLQSQYTNQLCQAQASAQSNLGALQGNPLSQYQFHPTSTTTTAIPNMGLGGGVYTFPYPTVSSHNLDFIVDMIFAAVQKSMQEELRKMVKEIMAEELEKEAKEAGTV